MHIRRILAASALIPVIFMAFGVPASSRVAAASKVTVTYWTHVNAPAQALEKKLIAQFEAKYPNITINYLPVDFNSLPTKLTTALAGGSGPDIFNYFQSFALGLVRRGFIVPVDFKAFGVGSQAAFSQRYLPSVLGGFTFNGMIYGVPHEVSNFAFWINTDMFKAAGLNPATDFPKTWSDVSRLGAKLTVRKNGKIVREGLSLPLYNALRDNLILDAMTRQAGGRLFSDDGKKAFLNSPAAVKALQTWSGFVHVDKINDPALGPTASGNNLDLFGNGTAAMTNVGGSWFTSILQQTYPKVYKSYMVGPEPIFPGGPNVGADLYGFGLFVTKTSQHPTEAWEFARFLADNGDTYFTDGGIWLGGKATLTSKVTMTLPHWNVFKASFAQGFFLPPLVNYNQLSQIIERAIERSVLNGQSPQSSLNQAQQEAQPLMQ
jgi:multiple sugar transport system substrate-binding protein